MIYEDWKKWPESDFLKYTDREAVYFDTLVRRFRISREAKVLEIGFGNGGLLGYMRSSGRSVCGIETNRVLVDRASRHDITCYHGLREVPAGRFDCIFLMDVLEHINQSEIPLFFNSLETLLAPKGLVILRSPNGHSPLGLSNQHGDATHVTVVTIPKIELWLQHAQSLRVAYSGWDLTPTSLTKPIYSIKNLLRMAFARAIEKMIRLVFRPQPSGLLSANLLVVLQRVDDSGGG